MLSKLLRTSVLAAVACCAGCGGAISSPQSTSPTRGPLPTPTPVGLETPAAGKIYLGAYSANALTLEAEIGRKLAMNMHYLQWTDSFPSGAEDADSAAGRLPIDSWNCQLTDAQIAAGQGDPLITTRALAIKNFGHPVFLRYLWDMNLPASTLGRSSCLSPSTDNANGTFSATQFIAAWQHIHAIFAQQNVTNVIWVWSVSSAGGNPAPYYPGDAYVDWVGVDAYDATGAGFAPTIAPIYALTVGYHKPIVIAETGESPTLQPAFFAAAGSTLPTQFPAVNGLIYYDAVFAGANWLLSAGGLSAFATFGAEPYLSAFGSL
jgi:hypothetical protein